VGSRGAAEDAEERHSRYDADLHPAIGYAFSAVPRDQSAGDVERHRLGPLDDGLTLDAAMTRHIDDDRHW
jgi:hypothetical protein